VKKIAILAAVIALYAPLTVMAQNSAPAATASAPAVKGVVLATVGDMKIMSDSIEKVIASNSGSDVIPPEMVGRLRQMLVERNIMMELTRSFLVTQKVEVTEADAKEQKDALAKAAAKAQMTVEKVMAANDITDDMIMNEVKLRKLMADSTTKEKIDAFIKAYPNYFNGSAVKASHILLQVSPTASTAELKAAKAKLEGIAADIKSGKIKFEEAAAQFSECPSKTKGGDLGEWTYGGSDETQMDKLFSKAAFATKVGELTPVVHTQFGFHLIKVTGLTEGKDKPGEDADKAAKEGIVAEIFANILDLPMTTVTVTTMPAMTMPAATAPATAATK
jgi:parvulin-like peptidyl-prolyl isomerase